MSDPIPPTSAELMQHHRMREFRQWLSDPGTRKFLRSLEQVRIEVLTKSAENASRTGVDNAREHNQLIEARTYRKIIETYGHADRYPYATLDATDTGSVLPE